MISLADKFVHPTKGFDIDAFTLGCHLGRVVRFGGACNTYYTVLQHSLFVGDMAGTLVQTDPKYRQLDPFRACVLGMLHDAHEFLSGDWPTDWKTAGVTARQSEIDALIYKSLKVAPPRGLEVDLVKQCDSEALAVEGNYMSPFCLVANPPLNRPDLIEKWKDVFKHVACPDPELAFKRNWFADGYYVKRFSDLFDAMTKRS